MSHGKRSGCATTAPATYASIWKRLCRLLWTPLNDPAGEEVQRVSKRLSAYPPFCSSEPLPKQIL